MSNPSFSNIDLWLFELAEGNLTPSQIEQLEMFLLQHPELDAERDAWELAKANQSPIAYDGQEGLIKKRPVAWYIGGATAVVAILLLLLTGATGGGLQPNKNTALNSIDKRLLAIAVQNKDNTEESVANNSGQIGYPYDKNYSVSEGNLTAHNAHVSQHNERALEVTPLVLSGYNESYSGTGLNATLTENILQEANQIMTSSLLDVSSGLEAYNVKTIDNVAFERSLEPHPLRGFEIVSEEEHFALVEKERNNYGIGVNHYKESLRSKLNRLGRRIQRMMDNPVALRNYRDPNYHVPGMLVNDVNMSSAGTLLSTRVQVASRVQWLGESNQQLMNQLAVDGYVFGLRGGVGLQVNHALYDDGVLNIGSAALTYSPKMSFTKSVSVEPSLRFKMGNKSLTKSKVDETGIIEVDRGNAHDFYPDNAEPIGGELWYKDLGAGVMVNTEWFYAGVQLDNLFRHKDNLYNLDFENPRRADLHFIGSIGTDWVSRKENLRLSPYLVYQNYGDLSEAWLGANFKWNWFTAGGGISSELEPAASIGVKFDQFAFTYGADYVKSDMTGKQSLSHQVTLRFVGKPSRFGKRILNL